VTELSLHRLDQAPEEIIGLATVWRRSWTRSDSMPTSLTSETRPDVAMSTSGAGTRRRL
jgi:hypothetical protein